MNLENRRLSERKWAQKAAYGLGPFICNVCDGQTIQKESRLVIARGWGWGHVRAVWRQLLIDTGFLLGVMSMF